MAFECTSNKAWAELVRTERQSAMQLMQELAIARSAIAHLANENTRLLTMIVGKESPQSEA